MPKWLNAVIGAAEIAGGLVAGAFGAAPVAAFLLKAGISTELIGISQLLAKSPLTGISTATKNPIAPWNVIYGRVCHGGVLIFINSFGDNDKYLDMVFVLACHPCENVYGLLLDRQPVQIDTTAVPPGVPASTFPAINGGTSFTPVQQTVNISSISRNNDVVTVSLSADIPLLTVGNYIIIQNVTGDKSLNGKFQVAQILSQIYNPGTPGSVTFTYLNGGAEVSYTSQGQAKTTWPDYGRKIYMEVLTGGQTLGTTFLGMTEGTPNDGNVSDLITNGPSNSGNPWTRFCSAVGRTVVMLRFHYNDAYFANGLPQISFLIHGKNNILDPRYSPPQSGYSENWALCVADMMCDPTWGFKCNFTQDLNQQQLITAAIISDEPVELAAPVTSPPTTENRYRVNGQFVLTQRRGEILLNLMTAAAGRITYTNAQYYLWPAKWYPTIVLNAPGYTGQAVITTNPAKVDGDQNNFPMLVSGTYPYLKSIANGGQVANASGFDITFSADQAATQLLNWEILRWVPTTGQIIAYVQVPGTLSSTNANVIYLNFGNPSITTLQTTPSATWDSDYLAVLHLENGTALSAVDSTTNGNNGVIANATAGGGEVGGAAFFDGTNAKIVIPHQVYSKNFGSFEMWIYTDPTIGGGSYYETGGVLAGQGYGPSLYAFELGIKALGWRFGSINEQLGILLPADGWGLVAMTWDYTGNVNVYVNGSLVDTQPWSDPGTLPSQVNLGNLNNAGTDSNWWLGGLDEYRASGSARSGGWFGTRYNNETSPGTFYSISFQSAMQVNSITPWGPLHWVPYLSARDLFNAVRGTYINQANNWQPSDFPPYAQDELHGYYSGSPATYPFGDANLYFDGGDRRYLDIKLPFTLSADTAQRLAKIILLRIRQQGTGTIILNMAGYQQTALDIVICTFAFLGWLSKLFEVERHRLLIDKYREGDFEVTRLGVAVDVQESDPSVYDWDPATEDLTPQGYQQSIVPTVGSPAAPTNAIAVVGPGLSINESAGVGQGTILVSWTAPADAYVTNGGRIDAQYQIASSPPSTVWIALPSVPPSVTQIVIPSIQNAQSYNIQIRSVNSAGVPSAWVDVTPYPITTGGALQQLFLVNGS